MKRKLLSFMLAICLIMPCAFALTACGSNPPDNTPSHTHEYASTWSHDQMGHWIKCMGDNLDECDNPTKSYGNHNYSNGVCTVCGRSKTHTCDFGDYLYDENYHWKECSDCDATTSKVEHVFSGKVCTICGYEQAGSTTNTHASRDLEIITIPAGIGTATLVKLPDGKDMLIDAGDGSAEGDMYVQDLIYDNVSDRTIEYFVLTNTDPSRVGSAATIFDSFTVLNFYRPDMKSAHSIAANLSSEYNSGNSPIMAPGEDYALALEAASLEDDCSVKVIDDISCDISYSFFDTTNNSHSYKIDFMMPIAVENRNTVYKNSAMISIEYKGMVTLVTSDVNNDLIDAYCNVYGTQKDVDILITSFSSSNPYAISRSDLRETNFLEKISLTESDYSIIIPINTYDVGELGPELGDCSTVYSILDYFTITTKVSTTGVLSVTAE